MKRAEDKRTGASVAIKVVEKPPADGEERRWKVLRTEVACLERLRLAGGHSSIIRLVEVRACPCCPCPGA